MGSTVLVVSLGRLIADHVRLEPAEACAVVVKLWEHVARTGQGDDALPAVPPLDAVGITAFGDFEVREPVAAGSPARRADEIASELASVFRRLLASGRETLAVLPAQVLAACRPPGASHAPAAALSPAGWLDTLAPYQPADPSDALAMVFARWMRLTDGGTIRAASDRNDA